MKLSWFAIAAALAFCIVSTVLPRTVNSAADPSDPLSILERYLIAAYARDFKEAYQYISALDRRLKDERSYVLERRAFTGFTLRVAKQLASYMELDPIDHQQFPSRAAIKMRLKVPDANKLASTLLDWDIDRLEALSGSEQKAILDSLEKRRKDRKLDMAEGEQSFDLVRETEGWKIFLNWAAGVQFRFQTAVPPAAPVEAKVRRSEVAVRPGELFAISLKITNMSPHALTARIGHLVEPREFRDYLDLVECGFLLPVRLLPGKDEEFTSTYLLRAGLPEGARQFQVTFAIALQD